MLNETGNILVYPFGFEPTYHKYRMDYPEKLKMGNNIFVGAMADIFGKWVPGEWIRDVMETCLDNPIHNYLFLTKNPERYTEVGVPAGLENMWYGTTITCDADADRFNYLPAGCNTFVSIEPLMGDIVSKHNVMFRQVDWIITVSYTHLKEKMLPVAEERNATALNRVLELTAEITGIDDEISERQAEADKEILAMAGMEEAQAIVNGLDTDCLLYTSRCV